MNDPATAPLGTPSPALARQGRVVPAVARYVAVAAGGIALGVGIGALVWSGDDAPDQADGLAESPSTTEGSVGDGVRDPSTVSPCVESVESLERTAGLVADGLDAVRELRGNALRTVIEALNDDLPELRATVERCRAAIDGE